MPTHQSHVDRIGANSRDKPEPTPRSALVVEGGAMRAIFSAGVLDAFLEHAFFPFDLTIACSAGACTAASYLARQHGRSRTCYLDYMTRREFISRRRFLRGGHWLDLDWLWHTFERDYPLDRARLEASGSEFLVAATACNTGQPVYLKPMGEHFMHALKGSCAIPLLYRNSVCIDDQRLADGGIAAPIPVQEAYRRGAQRIVVIRSRPAAFVKRRGVSTELTAWTFRRLPQLAEAIRASPATYTAAVGFMECPPRDCIVLQVAPHTPLSTNRTSRDVRALERDYALGHAQGLAAMKAWSIAAAAHP